MQSINALSLAPDAHNWLSNSRHPRILHVFDHVCNLVNERREVLSIVTPQIGNGPFNLVIPRLRRSFERLPHRDLSQQTSEVFFNHLNVESPVSVQENQLLLGDFAISTANVKLWNPCPDWEMLHGKNHKIVNQLTKLRITNYLESGGLDMPLGKPSWLLDHRKLPITNSYEASQWDQFSNPLLSALSAALVTADISTAKAIASQLAGLGAGLTPAGDDFIMGAIYAAWIIHPADVARVLAEEISSTAAPLTTSLSAAWLKSAGKGEGGILWHEFFDALISANHVSIHEAMDRILKVGETSGVDAMAGFIDTFFSWAELASPKTS